MNHSNIRELDEDVSIFSKCPTPPAIKMFEVDPVTFVLTDITPVGATAVNIIEDYYRFTLRTPNKHCFLYIQFGLNGIIMRVGSPHYVYFMVALDFQEGLILPFRQVAFDGTVMQTGVLNDAGEGLYYLEIHDGINDSFVEVGGYANPVRPYLSVSSKLVKYELLYATYGMNIKHEEYKIKVKQDTDPFVRLTKSPYKMSLTISSNNKIVKV